MKKIAAILTIVCVFPALSAGEESTGKSVMVLPFKTVSKQGKTGFSAELMQVFISAIRREGNARFLPSRTLAPLLKQKKIDTRRIARVAKREDIDAVVWGVLKDRKDGSNLLVKVLQKGRLKKPRTFTLDGPDLDSIMSRLPDLAEEIGGLIMSRPVIGTVKVEGNSRISDKAVLNRLTLQPGTPLKRREVASQIREIYNMGHFDDVQILVDESGKGKVDLRIVVSELPSVKEIELKGNTVFSEDQILDTLTTRSFREAKVSKIRSDIAKIKTMYETKGYYEPKIDYDIRELSPNEAKLTFTIDEGQKSYLTNIVLDGATPEHANEVKKFLDIKEQSWFWWFDGSGTFARDNLERTRRMLLSYYFEKGFIEAKVGAPKLEIQDGRATITYPVREGNRFQVRKVSVEGEDLDFPEETLMKDLKTKPKTWYKASVTHDDAVTLTKMFQNIGYAQVDVQMIPEPNNEYDFVDIRFLIHKGDRIWIENVNIGGNDRTRDKIIRRRVYLAEGDLFNQTMLDETKKSLESMDYFENVKLQTSPGSQPDRMNVNVQVMEKKTGSLAAGMGYSSQDGAMGNIDLKERNLLGLGIVVNAKGNLSGRRNSYEASLTYPWLFDLPLSGSLKGYNTQMSQTDYIRLSNGFSVYFGFPVYGFWSASAGFARDSTKLVGFKKAFASSVSQYYSSYNSDERRFRNTSENALSFVLSRDTRNSSMIPTGGSKLAIGSRYSGLGGDVFFARYFTEATYYRSLFDYAVFKVRANASMLGEIGDNPIPFDRRVLLGGISSIRGYKAGEIGPLDSRGYRMGGDRGVFANLECLFPIVRKMKLHGVAFVDAGNAWNSYDSQFMTEIKAGAGVGVRWVSPMGPLRIEYGWKLTPETGDRSGEFAFAMGQLF